MKKHLIAAAVAAAVAVPAVAQVTVYGSLDAGIGSLDNSGATGDRSGVQYGGDVSQRLGLRGTEDLGGGLKASFVLEGAIGANQSGDVANGTAAFTGFGRAQFIELSGGFGALRVGYANSISKDTVDGFQVGATNNTVGKIQDIIAKEAGRTDNIRYTSPAFSGLTVAVGVESVKDDGDSTGTGQEVGLRYAAGPFNAAVSFRSVKNDSVYKTEQTSAGVSYNLGVATLLASYSDITEKDVAASQVEERGHEFGVRVPFGGALSGFASIASAESKTGTAAALDRDAYQIGIRYALSKRTHAYVIKGETETNTSVTAQTKVDQYTVGLVHKF